VPLLAGEDGHGRGPLQAVCLDVPTGRGEDVVASRGEASEARHLRPGREAQGRVGRESEEVEEPPRDDVFDDGGGRAERVEARVLVPRGGEPVRREGCGEDASLHEPEEAPAGRRDETGIGGFGQLPHDRQGVHGIVR
jgi:hypothetical protein